MKPSLVRAATTAERDRVADLAKVTALVMVIIGHSFAWQTADGRAFNVLEIRPWLVWVTWLGQVVPIFFAMGALANQHSWESALRRAAGDRDPYPRAAADFRRRRLTRLLGPVLVYVSVWTALLAAAAIFDTETARTAGRFLTQLLWFVGVYLAVTAAVPRTWAWHRAAAPRTLVIWFALIATVDVIRASGAVVVGWANLLLVWGWLHQWGYLYPRLRVAPRRCLAAGAGAAMSAALVLVWYGPYSRSLVTVAGERGLTNLSPPSVVLALQGLAMLLLLAALDGPLAAALAHPRLWTAVAILGSRGIGLYLWHIPVVAGVVAAALATGWAPVPFGTAWWAGHVATGVLAISGSFLLAGAAQRIEARLPAARWAFPAAPLSALSCLLILHVSVTGLLTWWGPGALGLPGCAPLNLLLLWAVWLARGPAGEKVSAPPEVPRAAAS